MVVSNKRTNTHIHNTYLVYNIDSKQSKWPRPIQGHSVRACSTSVRSELSESEKKKSAVNSQSEIINAYIRFNFFNFFSQFFLA